MQLSSRTFGRKATFDFGTRSLALRFQLLDVTLERGFVSDSSVQALATEDAQLDLSHVQPTARLRRAVKLRFAKYPPRLCGRERLIAWRVNLHSRLLTRLYLSKSQSSKLD